MAAKLNYYTMRSIFQYLNAIDLHHASLVCRSWLEIAEDENNSRGPVCITKPRGDNIWKAEIEETLNSLRIKAYLQIHIHQNESFPTLTKGCYCRYKPRNCLSLFLGKDYVNRNGNYITNFFLPDVSSIKIITRSYIPVAWEEILFCPEINAYILSSLYGFDTWQSSFDEILFNTRSMSSCMIFFCDQSKISVAKSIIQYYSNWFLDNKISVWGGISEILRICFFNDNKHYCRTPLGCETIFISAVNMTTWTIRLQKDSFTEELITMKLQNFKTHIKFRRHSIGFIYVSSFRYNEIKDLEYKILKKLFPNMPIVFMCGNAGFGDLKDILKTITKMMLQKNVKIALYMDTVIMILTYNE